jgi:hypothetical protein
MKEKGVACLLAVSVLSQTYGCMTNNNNGVLDWMIEFMNHSFTITSNHNNSTVMTA